MKPQDIAFFIGALAVIVLRKPKIAALLGLISLIIAVPLFAKWVFFTAERLTYYAAGFFLVAIIIYMVQFHYENRH